MCTNQIKLKIMKKYLFSVVIVAFVALSQVAHAQNTVSVVDTTGRAASDALVAKKVEELKQILIPFGFDLKWHGYTGGYMELRSAADANKEILGVYMDEYILDVDITRTDSSIIIASGPFHKPCFPYEEINTGISLILDGKAVRSDQGKDLVYAHNYIITVMHNRVIFKTFDLNDTQTAVYQVAMK